MDVGIGIALLAGFLSFASPCVLPIVPGYLTFITGLSFEELTETKGRSQLVTNAIIKSLPFVLGFSLVFISLGASASVIGTLMRTHLGLMKKIAGLGIILLGLHLAGLLPIPALLRAKQIQGEPAAPGMMRAFIAGVFFAFGWTPCVGPILAGILALAATAETLQQGIFLLSAYSLGLGIPFILSAAFLNGFLSLFSGVKKYMRQVEVFSGVLLVVVGGMIFADKLAWISARLTFLNPEALLVIEEQVGEATSIGGEGNAALDGEGFYGGKKGRVAMIEGIFHVNVNVSNFERSLEFYKMLGFKVVLDLKEGGSEQLDKGLKIPHGRGRAALLLLGDDQRATRIDLIEWKNPQTEGKPYPHLYHTGICRIALRTKNLQQVYEELKAKGVEFFSEPQVLQTAAGNASFVCFTDPDGTILELIEL